MLTHDAGGGGMISSSLRIWAWCFYDFANSAFSTIILTVAYGIYFKSVLCQGKHGDFLWGLSIAIAYFLAAFMSPILGAFSDQRENKKFFLIFLTLISILSTLSLGFLGPGMILTGMLLFIIGFFGFATANIFYNAFLLDLSTPRNIGRISGYGWGLGYLGGLGTLVLCYPWLIQEKFPITFIITALFFLIFSLPAFLFLKSKERIYPKQSLKLTLSQTFSRLNETRKNIRQYRALTQFLIAYFFYNDGLSTIITFSSIYAHDTLAMTMREVTLLFAMIQITAFLGAFVSGFIVDRIGAKRTILITLFLWMGTTLGAYLAQNKITFWIVSIFAGLGLGSCQSASRCFIGLLTPKEKSGEFFGFFAVFTKCSSMLGPLLFGLTSQLFASQRKAILTVLIFFILGAVFLFRIKTEKVENGNQSWDNQPV